MLKWKEKSEIRPNWEEVAPHSKSTKMYWAQWKSLRVQEGVLHRLQENPAGKTVTWQFLLPKATRNEASTQLYCNPTAGHIGVNKTLGRITRFHQDVKRWCTNCDLCTSLRGPSKKPRAPMSQYNVGAPSEKVAMELLGPLHAHVRFRKQVLTLSC